MIIEDSIKVSDYKCFSSSPQGFDKIFPINIIIGRNNAGKSSLIDLIGYTIKPDENFIKIGRGRTEAQVLITHVLSEKEISAAMQEVVQKASVAESIFQNLLASINFKIEYQLSYNSNYLFLLKTKFEKLEFKDAVEHNLIKPIPNKIFKRIDAERNIVPEDSSDKQDILSNGDNATSFIRRSINNADYDQNLIKKELLNGINEIINPEINFVDILAREKNGKWEVYFEDKDGAWIALSKMGSGIKTIILVLLNLLVIPKLNNLEFP